MKTWTPKQHTESVQTKESIKVDNLKKKIEESVDCLFINYLFCIYFYFEGHFKFEDQCK